MAQAVGISADHIHREGKQQHKDVQLKAHIEAVWHTEKPAHPGYGPVRLGWHLGINHKRISRVMKKFGLHPPRRRRHHYCTQQSKRHHSYTNLIHHLVVTRSNQVWVYDVSFFWFQGCFWYLATIEDLFTRQILAAQVSRHHDRFLILSVSKQAVERVGYGPDTIHSDQGTEFLALVVTTFWEAEQGTAISVSDPASPWQNGYKESFFGHFKDDLGYMEQFNSPGEFIAGIYEQVRYYNQDRLHRSLKMTPNQFTEKVSENSRHVWGT